MSTHLPADAHAGQQQVIVRELAQHAQRLRRQPRRGSRRQLKRARQAAQQPLQETTILLPCAIACSQKYSCWLLIAYCASACLHA